MQTDPVNHLSMGQPYCNIGFYSKIDTHSFIHSSLFICPKVYTIHKRKINTIQKTGQGDCEGTVRSSSQAASRPSSQDIILQICESYNDFFVQLCVVKKYLNELKFFDLTIFCFVIMIYFYAFCHYVLIRGVFKK